MAYEEEGSDKRDEEKLCRQTEGQEEDRSVKTVVCLKGSNYGRVIGHYRQVIWAWIHGQRERER